MRYVTNYNGEDQALSQEFRQISESIEHLIHFFAPVATIEPANAQKGQIAYANSTYWDPGAGSGLYSFDGTTWNKIGTAGGGGATQLDELSDVSTAPATNRFVLAGNGSVYAGRVLVEADISDLQGYSLPGHTHVEADITDLVHTGGSGFLDISETDVADPTNYYYGGLDLSLDWKINRYLKTTLAMESADEAGNPSETSLALAWADRTTLSYS